MQKVLITGGTGLVGRSLCKMLSANGYEVIILSRHPTAAKPCPGTSYARWDVEKGEIDERAFGASDHIIHLAGAPVMAKRWSEKYKEEIVDSRTKSSALLVNRLNKVNHKVKTIISASAIGFYGIDPPPTPGGFTEDDPSSPDFLGETCRLWEQSIEPAAAHVRLAKIRIGIVLSNDGGAYEEFKKPLKFGVASILGSGKQIISWIHIEDLCRMFLHALKNPEINGTFNAVAPHPVSNKTLQVKLAEKMRGKFFTPVHVPAFALKLVLGARSYEVLKSTTVSAAKIQSTGFQYSYKTIDEAIEELVVSQKS
jgi:uncharacterized protein